MKSKFKLNKVFSAALSGAALCLIFAASVTAQIKPVTFPAKTDSADDFGWWYPTLGVLLIGLIGAVVWWLKSKKAEKEKAAEIAANQKNTDWESNSLDADKEMEWLRKNQNVLDKKRKRQAPKKVSAPEFDANQALDADGKPAANSSNDAALLPVFSFEEITPATEFSPLPLSNNEALLSAIEQTHEEDEEDEEVRDLTIRILTAFKTRNSVEALTQIALYDLSSSLRSKAVSTLADFNHESVFEAILLACADPTREVRAAAARGISRLSFDRTNAWARIAQTGETGRIGHAARAAIEGGFVERSFERLINEDRRHAYEAFVLLFLVIKSGNVELVSDVLKNHPNTDVRRAVVHLIKVTKEPKSQEILCSIQTEKNLPAVLKNEIEEAIEELNLVAV